MSMSTPDGGGTRRAPITRPGAKPKDGDEPDIVISRPRAAAAGSPDATTEPAPDETAGTTSEGDLSPRSAADASVGDASVGDAPVGDTPEGDASASDTPEGDAAVGGAPAGAASARRSGAAAKKTAGGGAVKKAAGRTTPGAATGGAAARKTAPSKTAPAKAGAATGAPAKKATPAKGARPAAASAGSRTPGKGPAKASGGKKAAARKTVKPVNIHQSRNWGPIILFGVVILIVLGIIGFGGYQLYQNGRSWQDRAASIPGIKNYRKDDPKILTANHKPGKLTYPVHPPVGGDHNANWQRCLGDVYGAPIADEHAVHSEEHGAVWITYQPSLPKSEVDALAKRVRGHDFTLMSPYPGLDKPISLQTWGYQLKVDKASDPRIDQFISALREVSAKEPNTPCSSGSYITETGTTPHDLSPTNTMQTP